MKPKEYLVLFALAALWGASFLFSDTLKPLEGDKLLSIGGTLTMFLQEPHSQVGGCTHNLTQTTQV